MTIMAVFVCERGSLCVLEADVHATQSSRLPYRDLPPEPKITTVSGSDTRSHSRLVNTRRRLSVWGELTLWHTFSLGVLFYSVRSLCHRRCTFQACPDLSRWLKMVHVQITLMMPGAKLAIYHPKQWERRNSSYLDTAEWKNGPEKTWFMLSCDNAAPLHPSIHHHFIHPRLISYLLFSLSFNGLW